MRTLLLLACLVIALFFGFMAFNWQLVTEAQPLSIGVTTVEAPLGLVMLAFFIAIAFTLAIQLAIQYVLVAKFKKQQAKALATQRTLAEQAEASRFSELRATLLSQFERMTSHLGTSQDALRQEIRESANSIAAMLGEMDDRLSTAVSAHTIVPMPRPKD